MGGIFISVDNPENYYKTLNNLKIEIKNLNSDLKEKDFILERTKEYLFILENKINLKKNQDDKIKEVISEKEKEINSLKEYVESIKKLNKDKFIFSIVIPIYNTEKYLSEAIDSVLSQSFSFENVEVLLIDGGSSDNSKKICEDYANKYPDNIKLIVLEGTTLSFKRNEGLKIAQGKFINFLDSDDKLEPNTLNEIFYHFNKFGDEIDVISMPRWRFYASEGLMPFYNKYDKSRIVDINEEHDFPIMPSNSAFLRRSEALKFEFDERLVLFEDCHFMTELILEKEKFGVVDSVKYLCRKRSEENSLVDTRKTDKRFFNTCMKIHFKGLIRYSNEKCGHVLKYVQHVLMYGFKRYFLQNNEMSGLNKEELIEFYNHLHDVLLVIDDDVILSQGFSKFIKYHMLNIKYGDSKFIINSDEDSISLGKVSFDKLSDNKIFIKSTSEEYLYASFKFYPVNIKINAFANDDQLDVLIENVDEEISISSTVAYTFNFRVRLDSSISKEDIHFEIEFNSNKYSISIHN